MVGRGDHRMGDGQVSAGHVDLTHSTALDTAHRVAMSEADEQADDHCGIEPVDGRGEKFVGHRVHIDDKQFDQIKKCLAPGRGRSRSVEDPEHLTDPQAGEVEQVAMRTNLRRTRRSEILESGLEAGRRTVGIGRGQFGDGHRAGLGFEPEHDHHLGEGMKQRQAHAQLEPLSGVEPVKQ